MMASIPYLILRCFSLHGTFSTALQGYTGLRFSPVNNNIKHNEKISRCVGMINKKNPMSFPSLYILSRMFRIVLKLVCNYLALFKSNRAI